MKYIENNSYYSSTESYIFLLFFLSHIPITILIDFQAFFAPLYPAFLKDAIRVLWIEPFGDRLLETTPYWFKSFIVCEALQLLYFLFISVQWFRRRWDECKPISLIYASHVCTTMVAILGELKWNKAMYAGSTLKHVAVCSVYSIYLIIPLFWLLRNLIGFSKPKQA